MLNFTNLLFIFIILVLLNSIKINKKNKTEKYTRIINNKIINDDNIINKNEIDKILKQKQFKPLFGVDQFTTPNPKNNIFEFQDIDFLNENTKLPITNKLDFTYDDETIIKKFYKEGKTGIVGTLINPTVLHKSKLPSDQKALYDYTFYETKNKKLEKIINAENLELENKSIKEVYDDLITDFKKINPQKKQIIKKDKILGAFGETTLNNIEWEYEDDTDNMGFDPTQSLELALV